MANCQYGEFFGPKGDGSLDRGCGEASVSSVSYLFGG